MATDIIEQFSRVVFRSPVTASLDTKILEAMIAMARKGNANESKNEVAPAHQDIASTDCVIVVEQSKVVGLLTTRDMVSFAAQQLPVEHLTLREVITHKPITAKESALTDLPSLLNLFEQHQISHLPILDEQDGLAGLISYASLLRGINAIAAEQASTPKISEERWQLAFRGSKDGIWDWDLKNNVKFFSSRWKEMRGFRDEEIGTSPEECLSRIHPEDYDRAIAALSDHLAGETEFFECEYRAQCKDASYLWVLDRGQALRDEAGQVIRLIGSDTDINARKAAELALQESQAQFQHMTENVPGMIYRYVLHPDGTDELTYVSSQIREVFELEPEAALQRANILWERIHPNDIPWLSEACQVSAETLEPFTSTYRLCLPEKGLRWVQNMSHVERLANGDVVWDGIAVDITDRKQQEQERERLLKIVESTSDYIGVASAEGYILWHNQAFKNFRPDLGNSADRIHLSVAHSARAYETMQKEVFPTAIEQGTWSGESVIFDADGNEVPISQVLIAHKSDEGEVEYFSTIIRDISDRKTAEQELILKQNHLEALLNNIPHMAWIKDEQSRFIAVNQPFGEAAGEPPEALVGKTDYEFFPFELAQAYRDDDLQVLQSGQRKVVEEELSRSDGTTRWLETTKTPFHDANEQLAGTVGIAADITDRKIAELALKESQAQFRSMTENVPGLIFRYVLHSDGSDELTYVSSQVREIFELEPEAVLQDTAHMWERIHPDDLPRLGEVIQVSAETLQPFTSSYRLTLPEKGLRWVQNMARPEQLDNGDVVWDGVAFDISDRIQAEAEQQRQLAILASTSDFIGTTDPDGKVLYLNEAWQQLLQRKQDEPASRINISEQHPAWALDIVMNEALPEAARQGMWCGETALLDGEGQEVPVSQVVIAHKSSDDEVEYFSTIMRDISERKQVEQQLQALSERLELALEGAQIGVWQWDYQSNRLSWDERMFAIYGIKPEDFGDTYQDFEKYVHPDDLTVAREGKSSAHSPLSKEFRIIRSDGTIRYLFSTALIQQNDQGESTRAVGINLDITDRKQAEIALEEEILRRSAVFNTSHDGIHILDRAGNLMEANTGFAQMLGYNLDELSHLNVADWDAKWSHTELQDRFQNYPDNMHSTLETLHRRKDGFVFPVEITVCSMEWNEEFALVCISRDISERKKYEIKLQQTNDELARATRLKDEFLANMSHELRTPLNSILGFSEALQEEILGPLDEKQIQAIKTIENSGNHLLGLINDILDVAKIESGKIELHKQLADISYLCNSSIVFIKQQALKKNLRLSTNITHHLPMLLLDERRILQVLINLLDNAVKFTPKGGRITLEASYNEQDEILEESAIKGDVANQLENQRLIAPGNIVATSKGVVTINISDTGIGIVSEDIESLFKPFIQIDSALNRKYEGTGLGLTLAKRIVELHGGIVTLSSEVGIGSCFSIKLPCETHSKPVETNPALVEMQPQQSLRQIQSRPFPLILLAEDHESNVSIIVNYLEFHGYHLIVAKNGLEAIELAKSHEPSLILMDIQMPQMNGIEAMKRIRQDEKIKDTPMVALTALAMKGDEERCLLAGANAYLSKPVKLQKLQQLVLQLLNPMT